MNQEHDKEATKRTSHSPSSEISFDAPLSQPDHWPAGNGRQGERQNFGQLEPHDRRTWIRRKVGQVIIILGLKQSQREMLLHLMTNPRRTSYI